MNNLAIFVVIAAGLNVDARDNYTTNNTIITKL